MSRQEVHISLGERSCTVVLGRGILSGLSETCRQKGLSDRIVIVTDKNVAKLHLRPVSNVLKHHGFHVTEIIIPAGERQKSLTRANTIITQMLKAKLPKRSALLTLGGGVVGDVAGFAAAIYRRGISLVHIPTTLLGQVESAIGGKTAVNHLLGKNAIGAYHQPSLVYSDIEFLKTLPRREIICGLGEIVKYGMISKTIFSYLDEHIEDILSGDPDILQEIIFQCNTIKAKLIEEDERETAKEGGRAVLNLGHTVGHALEDLSHYTLHHGEAVVLGLRWELEIARAASVINTADYSALSALLQRIPFHPGISSINKAAVIKRVLSHTAAIGMVLPEKIGSVIVSRDISEKSIREVSRSFKS